MREMYGFLRLASPFGQGFTVVVTLLLLLLLLLFGLVFFLW